MLVKNRTLPGNLKGNDSPVSTLAKQTRLLEEEKKPKHPPSGNSSGLALAARRGRGCLD